MLRLMQFVADMNVMIVKELLIRKKMWLFEQIQVVGASELSEPAPAEIHKKSRTISGTDQGWYSG